MDNQTLSMINDAKIYQGPETGNYYIVWEYETSRYFLTIDNKFTVNFTPLVFKYKKSAENYLIVLQEQE